MKRMLRFECLDDVKITDEKPLITSEDREFIESCSLSQLEEYKKLLEYEIDKRLSHVNGMVQIEWEGFWSGNAFEKKPYLAVLKPTKNTDETIPYPGTSSNFLLSRNYDLVFIYLKREGKKFSHKGKFKRGTVLKARVTLGDDRFYVVESTGLRVIQRHEAYELLKNNSN